MSLRKALAKLDDNPFMGEEETFGLVPSSSEAEDWPPLRVSAKDRNLARSPKHRQGVESLRSTRTPSKNIIPEVLGSGQKYSNVPSVRAFMEEMEKENQTRNERVIENSGLVNRSAAAASPRNEEQPYAAP